jgi:four helix bundle protein
MIRMRGDNIAARLVDFGAAVVTLTRSLPQDRAGKLIVDQLLRSATAGGSNYEEARSAQSRRDFVHKVSLAAKEMREALYWLGLVARTEPSATDVASALRKEGTELVAILMSSAKTARADQTGNGGQSIRSREPEIGPGNTNREP